MNFVNQRIYFREMKEKLDAIFGLFSDFMKGDVLDVGCGKAYLRELIRGKYTGIDITDRADIKKDINQGLPFADGSFDTVLALDILEHLDNIHSIFDEICRVARERIIVSLPNMYEWHFRSSFILGKFGQMSAPYYGLPETPPSDRHHWLFSLRDAQNFVKKNADKNNFEIEQEIICYYKYKKFLPRIITVIGAHLGGRFNSIFGNTYVAVLKRK